MRRVAKQGFNAIGSQRPLEKAARYRKNERAERLGDSYSAASIEKVRIT